MEATVEQRIQTLIESNKVMLFMKGSKHFPRCGFSGAIVTMLDELGVDYETYDVLSDPDIRTGIKEFSDWPTIPQLYVDKEFVGGSDIVRQMFTSGELQTMLGVEVEEVAPAGITLTDAAVAAIKDAASDEDGVLRLEITSRFQYGLGFGPATPGDLISQTSAGVPIHMDRSSAKRADGMTIDFKPGPGGGVVIDNPNEPAKVRALEVQGLKALIDSGDAFELFDVRTPEERATASIAGSRLLDKEGAAYLESLPKDTRLVFHCHHGGRSQGAAEHFLEKGWTNVWNVTGGIDAWARFVDTSVARY